MVNFFKPIAKLNLEEYYYSKGGDDFVPFRFNQENNSIFYYFKQG